MRPARSPRFSCARRKARPRAFAGCRRRSADTVCSRRSTPTGGSHYFTTPTAGAKVDKTQPTQVGRALKQLHIDHIPSHSPQARGRIERLWDTLQKRLPPLLRTNAITTMEAANRWLAEVYIEQHNARFAVA